MDFIKKKLFLLLCIAVVVLGIGIFVSGMMVSSNNDKELAAITTTIDSVGGLRPILEAEVAQAESDAQGYQQNLAVTEIRMEETSRRPVLHREVFPKLNSELEKDIHFEAFAKSYVGFVNQLLVRLNAGTSPTAQEQLQQIERFKTTLESSSSSRLDPEQIDKICKELCQKRAQEHAIYADPSCFCVYTHWKRLPGASKPMYADAWYTQLAAWIQEDVVTGIASLNGSSKRVLDSPVKRLLEISFSGDEPEGEPTLAEPKATTRIRSPLSTGGRPGRSVSAGRRSVGSETKLPKYVTQLGKQKAGGVGVLGMTRSGSSSTQYEGHIAVPFTEHHSNDIIDVVHFEVGVIIDSSRIHDFIHQLESQKRSRVLRIKTQQKDKPYVYVLDRTRIQEVLRELESTSGTTVSIHGLQINKSDIEMKEIHRNQITVLQMDIEPLDLASEEEAGYYYGNGSFKVLRLTCEYFFFKNGYADLQPEPIQEILNPQASPAKKNFYNTR